MQTEKHLWEVDHDYYCNEGNYFSNDCGSEFSSFSDFILQEGDSDIGLNLIFRWDWDENHPETGQSTFNGDPYYRNGKLKLFFIGQRKGLFRFSIIDVCRKDEDEVIKFLQPRMQYLFSLWQPLINVEDKE